jgi:Ca2+-binding RTX toxin-like protein
MPCSFDDRRVRCSHPAFTSATGGNKVRRRSTGAVALSGALLASLTVFVPGAAAVVTSSFSTGVLTVTSDDQGDEIVVRCSGGGFVRVNGARPDTGLVACTDVTSIVVEGAGGADDIRLQQVNDVIFTALVSASIDGGEGNDVVRASEVADSITAGDGDDEVLATPADGDSVDGGAGRDVLSTDIASDVAISDDAFTFGTDEIAVTSVEDLEVASSDAPETIDARTYSGTLELRTHDGDDVVFGGNTRNHISTGPGDDEITGGEGRDVISSGEGNDEVSAGSGWNDIRADKGDDIVVGGPDRDFIRGGPGGDTISGLEGNDNFEDGDGSDRIIAGAGNDSFSLHDSGRGNEFVGGPGRDAIRAQWVSGATLSDSRIHTLGRSASLRSIESAFISLIDNADPVNIDAGGFEGDTELIGNFGANSLLGGTARDRIYGGSGDDRLVGGEGADRLDGAEGTDTCDGGPGNDRQVHCEFRA